MLRLALLVLVLLANLAALFESLERAERLIAEGPRGAWILAARFTILLAGIVPAGLLALRLRRERRAFLVGTHSWTWLRLLVYVVFAAIGATTVAHSFSTLGESRLLLRFVFRTALLGGLNLWAVVLLCWPGSTAKPLPRRLRGLDLALANAVLSIVLIETALSVWSRWSSSPIFRDSPLLEQSPPLAPDPFFGFPLNSRSYHDTEFFPADAEDLVVAVVADSFGFGIVPFDYNFTTIAERRLEAALGDRYRRVAVHNFGIPRIGMPEYTRLCEGEVLATRPAAVVVCVFVGNDLVAPGRSTARHSFQNWRFWIVAKRLAAVRAEIDEGMGVTRIGASDPDQPAVPDWVLDPSLERPNFSAATFLRIEKERMQVADATSASIARAYPQLFDGIDRLQATLGDKLALAIIPDEFQVNDALYAELLAALPSPERFSRDQPQQRILAHCAERGIAVLDLLPVLRAAELRGHTYHMRDTHWNARGNAVVGEALAGFLLQRLSKDPRNRAAT